MNMKIYDRLIKGAFSPDDRETALMRGYICVKSAGGSGLFVEGHRGLTVFSSSEISFSGKEFSLRVTGRGLFLRALSKERALVAGELCAVYFERDRA